MVVVVVVFFFFRYRFFFLFPLLGKDWDFTYARHTYLTLDLKYTAYHTLVNLRPCLGLGTLNAYRYLG